MYVCLFVLSDEAKDKSLNEINCSRCNLFIYSFTNLVVYLYLVEKPRKDEERKCSGEEGRDALSGQSYPPSLPLLRPSACEYTVKDDACEKIWQDQKESKERLMKEKNAHMYI